MHAHTCMHACSKHYLRGYYCANERTNPNYLKNPACRQQNRGARGARRNSNFLMCIRYVSWWRGRPLRCSRGSHMYRLSAVPCLPHLLHPCHFFNPEVRLACMSRARDPSPQVTSSRWLYAGYLDRRRGLQCRTSSTVLGVNPLLDAPAPTAFLSVDGAPCVRIWTSIGRSHSSVFCTFRNLQSL